MIAITLATVLLAQTSPSDYKAIEIDGRPSVAILPMVNVSGEKWEELKLRQIEKGTTHLRDEFVARKFGLIEQNSIRELIREEKVDLTDEEIWKRQTFFDLGRKLKAKYVFFAAITSTHQKRQDRVFYTDLEGNTEIKCWFLQCEAMEPILSAKTFVGRSGGARIGDNKGSERQIQATANAVDIALTDFFKDYPKPAKDSKASPK